MPKTNRKDGTPTLYGFACGYIMFKSLTGKYIDTFHNGKMMFHDGCFHVKQFKNNERVSWKTFDRLGEARKHYTSIKVQG